MSADTRMRSGTGEHKRVTDPAPARTRTRPASRTPHPRRNRQLIILLALVIVAGFLLGLGLPIHG